MKSPAARPVGLTIIAVVIAINGIGSLLEAVGLAGLTIGAIISTILSALIGLALLFRAYGILRLKHRAWLATVLLLCVRSVFATVNLVYGSAGIVGTIDVVVSLLTLLYLIRPSVRSLFEENSARKHP
ncbi:MAG: hypothetical protein EPO21_08120 [Chloroflexota bacterium]|nr:MAG: hypothetical protein EPO21_08120 [Chloroflexota bacterium]